MARPCTDSNPFFIVLGILGVDLQNYLSFAGAELVKNETNSKSFQILLKLAQNAQKTHLHTLT